MFLVGSLFSVRLVMKPLSLPLMCSRSLGARLVQGLGYVSVAVLVLVVVLGLVLRPFHLPLLTVLETRCCCNRGGRSTCALLL